MTLESNSKLNNIHARNSSTNLTATATDTDNSGESTSEAQANRTNAEAQEQVQTFGQNKPEHSTYFQPTAALLGEIEKDCNEVERHLNEFKKRGISVCTHVAKIDKAFRDAGLSSDEFCSYMQGRFNVKRSTVLNYLRVGRCIPLRAMDIDLSKLQSLSTLQPFAVAKAVLEIGREKLDAMTCDQVKAIVRQQKHAARDPGDNSMLAAKTLKNILKRIDGLIDTLGPYVGIARDLRAADEIDIIGQMRELEMTLTKILDGETPPIPHEVILDELDYEGTKTTAPPATPSGPTQAANAPSPEETVKSAAANFREASDCLTTDEKRSFPTLDEVAELCMEEVAECLQVEFIRRESNPFLNVETEQWGGLTPLLSGPRARIEKHGSGRTIFIQYHCETRNSLFRKITLRDAKLYLKWLLANPDDILIYPDFMALPLDEKSAGQELN